MDDNQIDSLTFDLGLDSSGFKRGQKEIDAGLDEIEKGADSAAGSVDGLGDAAKDAAGKIESLGGKSSDAASGVKELSDSSSSASEQAGNLSESAGSASDSVEGLGDISEEAAQKIKELEEELEQLSNSSDESAQKIEQVESALAKLRNSSKKSGDEFGAHFQQMTRSARGLANELLAVAGLSGGSFALGKTTANAISEQADAGRRSSMIGMKPRDLKGWENTSEAFGGTAQEVDGFLQKLADIPTANILSGEGIPQWLTASGIDLSDGNGGKKDINEVGIEIMNWLNKQDEQMRSYIIRNELGGGQGLNALSGLGGDVLRSELQKGANRSGMTEDGVLRTQELQRKMTESTQELSGAWSRFIADNAPAITKAIEGIAKEFERFGKELTREMKGYNDYVEKHAKGQDTLGQAESYIETKIVQTVTGKSDEESASLNDKISERFFGKKKSQDGVLYDPSELPGAPEDPYSKMWWLNRSALDNRMKSRENLHKEGKSLSSDLRDNEAEDNGIWEKHLAALEWQKARTEEIQSRGFMSVYPDYKPGDAVKNAGQSSVGREQSSRIPAALDEMKDQLSQLEKQNGLPEGWMTKIAMKESSGNPSAVSYDKNGKPLARGMYQFTRDSAVTWGVSDPFDKWKSAEGAARFYGAMFKKFDGDQDKSMAAYHSGPEFVKRLVAQMGPNWRDGLGPKGAGYINHPYKGKADSRDEFQRLAEAASINELTADQINNLKTPSWLGPQMSPGVQNAMNSQDNRRTSTSTTHVEVGGITVQNGNAQEIANNLGSVIKHHPFLNGADYA